MSGSISFIRPVPEARPPRTEPSWLGAACGHVTQGPNRSHVMHQTLRSESGAERVLNVAVCPYRRQLSTRTIDQNTTVCAEHVLAQHRVEQDHAAILRLTTIKPCTWACWRGRCAASAAAAATPPETDASLTPPGSSPGRGIDAGSPALDRLYASDPPPLHVQQVIAAGLCCPKS